MSTKIRGLVVILVAYAVACGGAPSGSDITCKDGMECSPGEICFFQTCRQLCNTDGDCSGGLSCDDGVCVPGQSDGKGAGDGGDNPLGDADGADSTLDVAPLIFEVDGTGSVDGSPGHTAHHLRDRLLVIGQNLSGAALTLEGLDPVRAAVELDPCSTGTDTQVELGLPLDIVAGEYLLTASNQAGNCSSAPLFLLRGEQGQSGATGTVPSGLVGYFLGTCPPGWSTYAAAQGRVVVGVETAGTLEGTVGGALTDLAQRTIVDTASHAHVVDPPQTTVSLSSEGAHSHTMPRWDDGGGGTGVQAFSRASSIFSTNAAGTHSHSGTLDVASFNSAATGSASVDVTMPYVQLRVCSKD